jgi:hypothetical protein
MRLGATTTRVAADLLGVDETSDRSRDTLADRPLQIGRDLRDWTRRSLVIEARRRRSRQNGHQGPPKQRR